MNRTDVAACTTRVEHAADLIWSVIDVLSSWKIEHAGDELVRRRLLTPSLGLFTLTANLIDRLEALATTIGSLRCPHCGWNVPPMSVCRCPRCNFFREVRRDVGDAKIAAGNPSGPARARPLRPL